MAVNLSPIGNDAPFVDASGNPLSGGLLYTYTAGSDTLTNTYTTSAGNVANANPVVLNSNGYPASAGNVVEIWLTASTSYKFVLKTSAGVTVWTRDNISGINDTSVSADQWLTGPTPTYVSATSFTLVGDQTSTFQVGRRVKTTNTGGTIYSTITSSTFGASTTIVVSNDSGSLDSGLSAVSYGIISSTNTSLPEFSRGYVVQGRLTLTTAVPVTTGDVTAAETVYFTPFRGNQIDLYDPNAGTWVRYTFSELTLDVPDATQMNDVFIYNSSGTLTLEAVAWSNTTTRATALVTQNGVLVKSGATGRRYLGSFYGTTAGNGQTEDSAAKRYLFNYYNRVRKFMSVVDTTDSWAYSTATYQQANAAAANQLDMVIGVSEDAVDASVNGIATSSGATGRAVSVGVGVDSTSVNSAQRTSFTFVTNATTLSCMGWYLGYPGIGKHVLVWLEKGGGTDTQTWYGDNGSTYQQSGISGSLLC